MTDLDAALTEPRAFGGRVCEFARWLHTRTDAEQASIRRAVYEGSSSSAHIYRVLRELGCPSSASTLQKHRHGICVTCSTTS